MRFNLKKLQILLLLFTLAMAQKGFAQQVAVHGNVTDAMTGETMIGVTIVVEGTIVGTTTDVNGNYSIQMNKGQLLSFSFIGYKRYSVELSEQTQIDVQLEAETESLGEMIVIGYGVQKKSDKTGAVSQISSEELAGGSLTDPIQGLMGKAAGVSISKKGGDPNSGFSIRIRGASGFDSNTSPLFVIDGVPGADPTTVAPEDIERYDILKDAASTAIYGSQGSNGVIIITTRNGGNSSGEVKFNAQLSVDQVAKKLDMLTGDEIRQYVTDNGLEFIDGGANVDWQDQVYRKGVNQNYNLSFSGGNDASHYFGSVTRSEWQGVMKGTSKDRTIGKLSVTHHAIDNKLTLSGLVQGTFEQNDYESYGGFGGSDIIYQAIAHNPTDPVFNEDGDYSRTVRAFNYENPLAVINMVDNIRDAKRFLGNFKADLELMKGLTASVNLGYIRNDHENSYYAPKDVYASPTLGSGSKSYSNYASKLIEATTTYVKNINDVHHINALIGYSWQEKNYNGFHASAENSQSDYIGYNNLGSFVDVKTGSVGSYAGMSRLIGFFSRVQYNFNSVYYASASIRRDGSTKFGANNKWGMFPTASLGWNMHQESFLQSVDFIDQLKLRASYGVSGNQEIGDYNSQLVFAARGLAIDPETGSKVTTFGPSHNENPDLKWETTTEVNLGVDFGLFNSKINGSIEVYSKVTDDLLGAYRVPVPPNLAQTTFVNTGALDNKGIELFIQGYFVNHSKFQWKSSLSAAHNKTTIRSLGEFVTGEERKDGYLSGRGLIGDFNYVTGNIEGQELGAFYLPVYKGLSNDGKFLYASNTGGITRELTSVQREIVGSPAPDLELGWSNHLTFLENWTLDVSIRSLIGNDVYNATRMFFDYPNLLPSLNALPEAIEWNEQGRTNPPTIADIYVEDGSFVKIDYLSLGYNFSTENIKWLNSLRFNLSANNLLTLTKYTGIDPETSYSGLSFGVDQYNVYPKTRTLSFGINATF